MCRQAIYTMKDDKAKGEKLMKKQMKKQEGFTLVELMVVVAILGLLAGLMIPVFGGVQERAANNIHDTNVALLQNAGNLHVVMEGKPSEAEVWNGTADQNWETFIKEWADVPKNSTVYTSTAKYVVTIETDGNVVVTVESE